MLVEIAVGDRNDQNEHDRRDDRSSQVPRERLAWRAEQTESLVVRSELVELIAVWRLIGQVGSLARQLRLAACCAPHRDPDPSEFGLRASSPDAMELVVLEGVFETLLLDRTSSTD
jgi:hypothetical protein